MEDEVVELWLAKSDEVAEKLCKARVALLEVIAAMQQRDDCLQLRREIRNEVEMLNVAIARYLRVDDLRWRLERTPIIPQVPPVPPSYKDRIG